MDGRTARVEVAKGSAVIITHNGMSSSSNSSSSSESDECEGKISGTEGLEGD